MRRLLILAFLVAGCGAKAVPTPEITERATPAPTLTPWSLEVTDTTYDTEVSVGDTIKIAVEIENTGTRKNPATNLNFSELDQYADLHKCKPKCSLDDLPGFGPSAILPGVKPGETVTYTVSFIATKVGVVRWGLCVYEGESYSQEVWCGDATTAIR